MTFQPGDVVILKSGGQPMTVANVVDESIECIWIGEEGELFRENLPSIVLQAAEMFEADAEDEDEDEEDEAEESDDELRKIA